MQKLFWSASVGLGLLAAAPADAQTNIRVGWCTRTISSAAAPFAVSNKLGWFGNYKVQVVPLPSTTDCVKNTAMREVNYSLTSPEPLAIIRQQGTKLRNFYTAYQGFVYGLAVPDDSPIRAIADLKGKRIGVAALGGASVIIAKAIMGANGLDPEKDASFVVAGESAQTAALLRSRQVDALSQFDTQYALVENAGVKIRRLDNSLVERFPSSGLVGYDEDLAARRGEAIAVAQGYAKGTIFAMANPEAAIRILWETYPATRSTSKDEETALRDDIKTLMARAENWKLEKSGVGRWGESSAEAYQAYMDFLLKAGTLKDRVLAADITTNDLIDDINKFDAARIAADAKAYRHGK